MKIVSSAAHRRKLVVVLTFCLLLSTTLFAFYVYRSSSSQTAQWRLYGPTREKKDSSLGPASDAQRKAGNSSDYPTKRHLVSSNQVGRIIATMSSGSECNSTISPPKLILLWTPFYGLWEYFTPLRFEHCPNCTNCKVTADRNRLLESDAIVFHCRDMTVADVPYARLPHQRWVFYCLEPPDYSKFPGMSFMQNMFNWTMTYRYDSDIVVPYGKFQKISRSRTWNNTSLLDVWSKKTKPVVWMTSNCRTYGNRDFYVSHLRKYIDVDVYGSCGTLECARKSTHECLQKFSKKYKFFLAFENAICKDYVTEKFFRTFNYDIIPVVFGGAEYENFAPRGSYIDALSFHSPKHLAAFLSGVGSDFALYSAYFKWREDFAVSLISNKERDLCDLLHSKSNRKTVYEDMWKWWVRKGQCRTYEA